MKASAFQVLKNNNHIHGGGSGDAHFVCQEKQTFGIADAAGDSAKGSIYDQELMCNCSIALPGQSQGAVDPKRVLKIAYEITKPKGPCTTCPINSRGNRLHCLASIRGNKLHYVSIGESIDVKFSVKKRGKSTEDLARATAELA
ncbi:unnamed protein product [Dovyalis caffra]|uniref:Uncharacterized protein n=1 Tax=Dovyalis caffra TaxID=77055 RepID=A0AAV1RBC2_9ROSI|nr:unnamed protein product [Dovyalis caffra]